MSEKKVRYLLFDIESVADPELVAKVHYAGKNVHPSEAIRKYRDELLAEKNSDFIPYTFQFPISLAIAKIADDYSLIDLIVLGIPELQPHEITKKFWDGWNHYLGKDGKGPLSLVTFNGRGFDIPLMELMAFRYGIPVPRWFGLDRKTYDQPRNRYNIEKHFDLCDFMTNYGASRINGGLNLLATMLGKPGKIDVTGNQVQDLYDAGQLQTINDYCRCDVLDTYFTFLRVNVICGNLSLDDEQRLLRETKSWLELNKAEQPAYAIYLDHWGDWPNPWVGSEIAPASPEVPEIHDTPEYPIPEEEPGA